MKALPLQIQPDPLGEYPALHERQEVTELQVSQPAITSEHELQALTPT